MKETPKRFCHTIKLSPKHIYIILSIHVIHVNEPLYDAFLRWRISFRIYGNVNDKDVGAGRDENSIADGDQGSKWHYRSETSLGRIDISSVPLRRWEARKCSSSRSYRNVDPLQQQVSLNQHEECFWWFTSLSLRDSKSIMKETHKIWPNLKLS